MTLFDKESSDPPVINMVMALNSFSASVSWTPPPNNCSLNYILEVADKEKAHVALFDKESSDPPVINMLMALNSFSAKISWTPTPHDCSLIYILEVVDKVNAQM